LKKHQESATSEKKKEIIAIHAIEKQTCECKVLSMTSWHTQTHKASDQLNKDQEAYTFITLNA